MKNGGLIVVSEALANAGEANDPAQCPLLGDVPLVSQSGLSEAEEHRVEEVELFLVDFLHRFVLVPTVLQISCSQPTEQTVCVTETSLELPLQAGDVVRLHILGAFKSTERQLFGAGVGRGDQLIVQELLGQRGPVEFVAGRESRDYASVVSVLRVLGELVVNLEHHDRKVVRLVKVVDVPGSLSTSDLECDYIREELVLADAARLDVAEEVD